MKTVNRKSLILLAVLALVSTALFDSEAHSQTRRRRTTPRRSTRAATKRQPASVAATPAKESSTAVKPATATAAAAAAATTASGLTYLVTHRGTGRQPKDGDTVIVHYTGTLTNGVKFDSSRDRNAPFAFKLGAGRVIQGWDEGIARLHVGDRAVLVIPPQLGYGEKGAGNGEIPPGATLIFVVELVDAKAVSLADELSRTLQEENTEATVARFQELQGKGLGDVYIDETELLRLGYRLLRSGETKKAIEIFKINAEVHPQSANAHGSLAEAYAADGNKQLAIENYEKTLKLYPQSERARQELKRLTEN